jgi:ribosomal protein S18 acetylase RimI-like enzyme
VRRTRIEPTGDDLMTEPASPLAIDRFGPDGLYEYRDELLAVYAEVYADRLDDPFFSLPRYWERLEAYAKRDGFSLVTGRVDGELVGYALGYTLPAGSRWWQGFRGDVDPAELSENGHRTFALTEIMVRASWRRQGYARALHDALLAGRAEERATLLVRPDNIPARDAYQSWGWEKLGVLQPFDDAPVYDAMVLNLR